MLPGRSASGRDQAAAQARSRPCGARRSRRSGDSTFGAVSARVGARRCAVAGAGWPVGAVAVAVIGSSGGGSDWDASTVPPARGPAPVLGLYRPVQHLYCRARGARGPTGPGAGTSPGGGPRMPSHYGQFCPVAKAMELLDERWTLLVVRELMLGSRHFNALRRGVPRMSPALLSKRLHDPGAGRRRRAPRGRQPGHATGSPSPAGSSSRSSRRVAGGASAGCRSSATRTSTRTCCCGTSTAASTREAVPDGRTVHRVRASPTCAPATRRLVDRRHRRRGATSATSTRGSAPGDRRGEPAHPHPPVARRRRLGDRAALGGAGAARRPAGLPGAAAAG